MYKAVEATARQLVLWNIDDIYTLPWMKFDEDTSPFKAIQQYFPHELNQLKVSRLNTKTFNIAFYNSLFVVVLVLSCVAVLFSLPRSYRKEFYLVVGCIGAFMLLNAFTTAVLSSVNARFNSRMIWLVPFINMIILFRMIGSYYTAKKAAPGKAV
jgi:lipopolysaccharide export LptBFGC system permease protein LptF